MSQLREVAFSPSRNILKASPLPQKATSHIFPVPTPAHTPAPKNIFDKNPLAARSIVLNSLNSENAQVMWVTVDTSRPPDTEIRAIHLTFFPSCETKVAGMLVKHLYDPLNRPFRMF